MIAAGGTVSVCTECHCRPSPVRLRWRHIRDQSVLVLADVCAQPTLPELISDRLVLALLNVSGPAECVNRCLQLQVVGTANATAAGWGNLGGGVTQQLACAFPHFVLECGRWL